MKIIIYFIFLLSFLNLKAQVSEFDQACRIIRSIHGNKIKKIVVSDHKGMGSYNLYSYFLKFNSLDYVTSHPNIQEEIINFENRIIKNDININIGESKFYRRKGMKKVKSAILVQYIRFDGKHLRVNAEIGSFWKAKYKPSTSFYEYQFVFDQYGRVTFLDWIERKE